MRLSGQDGAGPEGDLELASCADEVEEFSARMRQRLGIGERSIAHTSSDNAADALAETIAGFFNPRSGFTRLRRQDRPRRVIASPPQRARKMFKVVALIDGVALSVYDGVTQYMPGTTWYQEAQANHDAGIYVYPSYEHCLKRDAESFPTDSVLLNAPRAIAAVLCWNEASWAVPVCYGVKCAYSYVHVLHIRPFPLTWYSSTLCTTPHPLPQSAAGHPSQSPEDAGAPSTRSSFSAAVPSQTFSPSPAAGSPRATAQWQPATSGGAVRVQSARSSARQQKQVRNATFAPGPVTLIRRQVTTLTLEDEVAQMEAQLTKIREGNLLS